MQHTNFENLLLDGEINENILNKALLYIGKVRNLEYKSSNGSSFVFISTENNKAVQYFNHQKIPEKIKNIFNVILSSFQTRIKNMKHSRYIGKIGLMIRNEKNICVGQIFNNLRTFNLQIIETSVPFMG